MALFRRLPLMLLGLIAAGMAAVATAGAIAFVTGWIGTAEIEFLTSNVAQARMHMPGMVAKAWLAAGVLALPFLGALLLIEQLRVRSLIWYGLLGLALALAADLMFGVVYARYVPSDLMAPAIFRPGTRMLTLLIAGTLAAATVYWAIAGRNAGGGRAPGERTGKP